jgi:hypothetical protein
MGEAMAVVGSYVRGEPVYLTQGKNVLEVVWKRRTGAPWETLLARRTYRGSRKARAARRRTNARIREWTTIVAYWTKRYGGPVLPEGSDT